MAHPARKVGMLVAGLLLLQVGLALPAILGKSPTVDEVTFVGAGYYMLRTGDFSMHTEHPVTLHTLGTVPLLFDPPVLPAIERPFATLSTYRFIDVWRQAMRFFWEANRERADRLVLGPRLVVLGVSLLLGLLVYAWAAELGGRAAGVVALFLIVASPNMLAHESLATLDLYFTAATCAAFYTYRRLLFRPSWPRLATAGSALAVLLLSKSIAPLFLPAYAVLAFAAVGGRLPSWPWVERLRSGVTVRRWLSAGASLAGVGLLAWLAINASYGFAGFLLPLRDYVPDLRASPGPSVGAPEEPGFQENGPAADVASTSSGRAPRAGIGRRWAWAGRLPVPFPAAFADQLKRAVGHGAGSGERTYILGKLRRRGPWYYHLFAFAIKVPVPMLLLLLAATIGLVAQRRGRWKPLELLFLGAPVVSVFGVTAVGSTKLGLRHVLPAFPFLFVFVAVFVARSLLPYRFGRLAFGALAVWYLAGTLWIAPHYLANFNELVGGPSQGRQYLSDSNIDWGQDLKGLKRYAEKHRLGPFHLSYFGSADPRAYGLDYRPLPSIGVPPEEPGDPWWYEPGYEADCRPVHGIVAVSVMCLHSVRSRDGPCFDWLGPYEPFDDVGYSILLYRVDGQVPAVDPL